MKEIQLTQGKVTLVDDSDYEMLIKHKWCAIRQEKNWYATSRVSTNSHTKMHRIIMGVTESKIYVDHKDGDGLNNQRANLRLCTNSQNSANRRKSNNSKSKYLGISNLRGKWKVSVRKNGKEYYGGTFISEEDAALAYNKKATEVHGEFARLNIISR